MTKQALTNPQVLHNYYAQLYGLTSPTASPYHQYLGYMAPPTPTPRAILPPPAAQQVAVQPLVQHPPPAQQVTVQPLLQHPPAQIQASFFPAPSHSHNFRLQLPPQAMSVLPPNTTGVYVCLSHTKRACFIRADHLVLLSQISQRVLQDSSTDAYIATEMWQNRSQLIRPLPLQVVRQM